jgi:alkaline phosphatase D
VKNNEPKSSDNVSRRRFLGAVAASASVVAAPPFLRSARGDSWQEGTEIFPLGVASGDPDHESVILWTRLAEDPLTGTGLPGEPIPVRWEVALDPGMRHLVRQGATIARPENGHAIRVLADRLPASCWLYYRFYAKGRYRDHVSRVGRTRTFPVPHGINWRRASPSLDPCRSRSMRFAAVSCQNYVQGYFPAWADIAGQDIDFVVHLGDYIYESGASSEPLLPDRNHTGSEIFSVTDYRNRYALYRLDQHLQDAHAHVPFIVTWDDHEVDNNYAGLYAEETAPYQGADFETRRRNAYQVYAESMPIRTTTARSRGRNRGDFRDEFPLYRRLAFGRLADIHVLDTRQYRTDQPAGDNFGSTEQELDPLSASLIEAVFGEQLFDANGILDPAATLLGPRQEAWLAGNLARSKSRWNVLAQQVMVMPWNLRQTAILNVQFGPDLPPGFPIDKPNLLALLGQVDDFLNVDAWDGYQAGRDRLLRMLDYLRPDGPVVLTGDIHSAWGAELLQDFGDPLNSDVLAAEFVCSSISSTFLTPDPRPTDLIVRAGIPDNPHIKYFDALFRGYCLCDVDEERWLTRYRAVGSPGDVLESDPLALVPMEGDPVFTAAEAEIANGFNARGDRGSLEVRI